MGKILTAKTEIESAIRLFRRKIEALAKKSSRQEWTFPGGEKIASPTYSLTTPFGELLVAFPSKWSNRVPHLFHLAPHPGSLSPHVEVNIPTKLDRRVSGAYLREGRSIWLCSRGDFTPQQGKISRDKVFLHFQKWLVDASDGDRVSQVIPVAALDSKSLESDLGEFVRSVVTLKSQYKEGTNRAADKGTAWKEGKEFEGKKHRSTTGETVTYDYLHGPLCNSLQTTLQKLVQGNRRFKVRRNGNVDAAVVDVKRDVARITFEVKTSSILSEQLYSAIGQLFYYRHKYGDANSHLFLVLPSECIGSNFISQGLFKRLGIAIIVRKKERFETFEGRPLAELVRSRLRA